MSPRSIRAYHARGLLAPPERVGKRVYYSPEHLERVKVIQRLQRKGLNLAAIVILTGENAAARRGAELVALLSRLADEDPSVDRALTDHGVLGRGGDGEVVLLRRRLIHSALALQRFGIPAGAALRLVTEVLERLRGTADDLALHMGWDIAGSIVDSSDAIEGQEKFSGVRVDTDADVQRLSAAAAAVLAEAFRVVADTSCARRFPQIMDECHPAAYADA